MFSENRKMTLYKQMFPLQLPGLSLAFIGCYDTDGAFCPIAELQTRLAARTFAGKHQLPQRSVMTDDVNKWNSLLFKRYGRYRYTV